MTSQIVIMNRLGFAFASDSAVSSGKFSSNSVQKIFSLPGRQPVAFMVMGSGVHTPSGLSWDRVFHKYHKHFIKKYGKNAELRAMNDYEQDFVDFLEFIISKEFNELSLAKDLYYFFTRNRNYIWDGVKGRDSPEYSDDPEFASDAFHYNIDHWSKFFRSKVEDDVEKKYQFSQVKNNQLEALQLAAKEIIGYGCSTFDTLLNISDMESKMVDFLAYHLVHYSGDDFWKDTDSTIVLGGFGIDDECPAYLSIKSSSVAVGLPVKGKIERNIVSTPSGITPERSDDGNWHSRVFMESFAIKSYTSRITTGLDSKLTEDYTISKKVEEILKKWLTENGESEFRKVSGVGESTSKNLVKHLLDDVNLPYEVGGKHWLWVDESASSIKTEFRKAVDRLSPIDLAKMATHLIETEAIMSSFVSSERHVDLPVDSCYVTKENGFVWNSLKNLPDPTINPKIFSIERDGSLFY